MYTSGSTGQPKGVCIPHRAIVRLVKNTNFVDIEPSDVFLQFAPFAFDAATFEVWGALLNGATLAIFPPEMPSLHELASYIETQGVTVLWLTAALFHQMADSPSCAKLQSLRFLLTGGEAPSLSHFKKAQSILPNTTLVNGYGPTENTTFSVCYRYPKADIPNATLPLGTPIAHSSAYVLDKWRQPVPIGVTGELYVGGDGLALGYLHQPELTAEKFVQMPSTLYRTGDLVRWLPDGNLEFLGRADEQIKLRGFRIELGEIESALRKHPVIQDAAVIVQDSETGDKRLLAFLVTASEIDTQTVRNFLTDWLPDYAIPSAFIILEKLPLTSNGKVDRYALKNRAAENQTTAPETETAADLNDVETRLIAIYQRVLNVPSASVNDDFFMLGGHSLLAVRLFVEIETEFARHLPLSTLFHAPTVRKLAMLLSPSPPDPLSQTSLGRGGESELGIVLLSPAEERSRQEEGAGMREKSEGVEISTPYSLLATPCSFDCLVPIQTSGTRIPFFAVHAIGANVLNYRLISKYLGEDQPFYGFQAMGLDGKTAPLETVEEMAAAYVTVLRSVQPHGPYFLGGGSSGGVIAFEMAQQLRASGETVGMVALLDTYSLFKGAENHKRHYMARVGLMDDHIGQILELPLGQQIAYLWRNTFRKLRNKFGIWDKIRPQPSDDLPTTLLRLRKAILQAVERYEPKPYAGQITMFLATQAQHRTLYDPRLEWGKVAKGGFELHLLDCDHDTLMEEPVVQELAQTLRVCMDRISPAIVSGHI